MGRENEEQREGKGRRGEAGGAVGHEETKQIVDVYILTSRVMMPSSIHSTTHTDPVEARR